MASNETNESQLTYPSCSDFLPEIPAEQKRLLELKFSVYTQGVVNSESGGWCAIIVDNRNKRTILKGKGSNPNNNHNRMNLIAILESLNYIYSKHEDSIKSYICIDLFTNSVYCTNTMREWIFKWIEDQSITSRPNSELLQKLYHYINLYGNNINIKWINNVNNEVFTLCETTAKEMIQT